MTAGRKSKLERWLARVGFAAGMLAVAVALMAWRVPPGRGVLGADVIFASAPSGELGVAPTGPFLTAPDLGPSSASSAAAGSLVVRNQTGSELSVRVRALPSTYDLDGLLRVTLHDGDAELFDGRLGGLRAWSDAFAIGSGKTHALHLQAWIAAGVERGFQGRVESIPLEFSTRPVRRTR